MRQVTCVVEGCKEINLTTGKGLIEPGWKVMVNTSGALCPIHSEVEDAPRRAA